MAVRGISAPLDPYITDDYNLDDYNEVELNLSRIGDGKLRSLYNESAIHFPLIINKDLFRQANVSIPDENTRSWSRAEFENAVNAIGKLGNGVFGFGTGIIDTSHDKFLDAFMISDGEDWCNPELDRIVYNTERNVKTLDWFVNLSKQSSVVPGTVTNNVNNLFEMFLQNKIGIIPLPSDISAVKNIKDAGIDFMFVNYPTEDGSVGKTFVSSRGFCIKEQDDEQKKKASADLVLWLTAPDNEESTKIWRESGLNFARKSLQEASDEPEINAYRSMVKSISAPIYALPGYGQIRSAFVNNIQAALLGQKTAEQALADFQSEAQQLLDTNK